MSLTLKILLMVDVFFALLLLVYVIVKYVEVFNRKPKIFKPEIINGVEAEVSYTEEPTVFRVNSIQEVNNQQVNNQQENNQEEKEDKAQKISIGSFEELEDTIKAMQDK